MFNMLAVLLGSTVASWGLLWFWVPVDWLRTSPTVVLSMHVLPPLLLTLGYYLWQRGKAAKALLAARAQDEAAEAERQQAREASRQQHLAALATRQAAVDCRWLWVSTRAGEHAPDWVATVQEGIYWQTEMAPEEAAVGDVLDYVDTSAREALTALYLDLPGAASLPLLLQAIPAVSGIEHVQRVKRWQQQAWQQACPDRGPLSADCRFLSGSGGMADRVLAYLQQTPGLPGVVLLGADAPCLPWRDDDEAGVSAARPPHGVPGAALVLALVLRDDLPAPAALAWQDAEAADPYQPYWERPVLAADQPGWGPVPEHDQAALCSQSLHVRLAQSSRAPLSHQGSLQLTRALHPLLDDALVNAGLLDYAFAEADAQPERNQQQQIAWLAHNSGDLQRGGMRLAALASNLSRQDIDLHPVDAASNTVRDWGDVGIAGSILLMATAVTHAHRLQAPVIQADFAEGDVAIAVVCPQGHKEQA